MRAFACVLVVASLGSIAQAAAPTVCTMTFNSNHESKLFKAKISKDFGPTAHFEELIAAPFNEGANEEALLPNACAHLQSKNRRCDIMIVSGHYGGTFFGANTSNTLSLETLERNSCLNEPSKNASCFQTLFNPKEVFLFGCNTLSGKEADSRTPEEYERVLLEDGLTPYEAATTTLLRYTDYGDPTASRMASVFPKTPLIYGFDSIAPSGQTVSRFLKKYFDAAPDYGKNLLASIAQGKNQALETAMRGTAFTQRQGAWVGADRVDSGFRQLTCSLADKEKAPESFAKLIERGSYASALPQILDLLGDTYYIDGPGRAELANAMSGQNLDQLKAYVQRLTTSLTRVDHLYGSLLQLQRIAGWISEAEVTSILKAKQRKLIRGQTTDNIDIHNFRLLVWQLRPNKKDLGLSLKELNELNKNWFEGWGMELVVDSLKSESVDPELWQKIFKRGKNGRSLFSDQYSIIGPDEHVPWIIESLKAATTRDLEGDFCISLAMSLVRTSSGQQNEVLSAVGKDSPAGKLVLKYRTMPLGN